MRTNRASTTAKLVALWRALADAGATTVPGFRDPFAGDMLTGGFRLFLSRSRRRVARMSHAERMKLGRRFDAIAIRVAVIDAELIDSVKAGCRQVVMLGAGFDTRSWRMDELAATTVFEVDHPATQTRKRELIATLPPAKAKMVFTPVDFERDSLAARLAAVGQDDKISTTWIWEGVVMYLADDAVASTLTAIRERSAAGSVLVLHYHEPTRDRFTRGVRLVLTSWLGEPQIGARTRGVMRGIVEKAGLVVVSDLGIGEQAAKVGAIPPKNDLAHVSRILVARVG